MANKILSTEVVDDDFSKNLADYYKAKSLKAKASEKMTLCENHMMEFVGFTRETLGTQKFHDAEYEVTFLHKQHLEVDTDKLLDWARENRYPMGELMKVFKFKAEVKTADFKALPDSEQKEEMKEFIRIINEAPTKKIEKLNTAEI